MKPFFKTILKYYLKYITRLVLFIHQPKIIAVAGSTNKSFVRDEIKKVLLEKGRTVRANPKNFNTEIGLPLAILGVGSGYGAYYDWLPIIGDAIRAIWRKDFPEYLVLELGVSQRGDMAYLLSIIRPEICVIADITQRYLEAFSGLDQLLQEYEYLVKNTKNSGRVILNYDNLQIRHLAKRAKAEVIYFGRIVPAEEGFRIEDIERTEKGESAGIRYKNLHKKLHIPRFGEHHVYAAAVGVIMQENI
ncbi:MAG: Mur ligase family protein [Parcubacteria group bacterium]